MLEKHCYFVLEINDERPLECVVGKQEDRIELRYSTTQMACHCPSYKITPATERDLPR